MMGSTENRDKVLRFPDRERGFIWKKRDPSGKWVEVNEDGSPLESPDVGPEAAQEADIPSQPQRRRPSKGKKAAKGIQVRSGISILMTPEMLEDLDDFILWKGYSTRVRLSRADVITEALELLMKRSAGFSEYRKHRSQ